MTVSGIECGSERARRKKLFCPSALPQFIVFRPQIVAIEVCIYNYFDYLHFPWGMKIVFSSAFEYHSLTRSVCGGCQKDECELSAWEREKNRKT